MTSEQSVVDMLASSDEARTVPLVSLVELPIRLSERGSSFKRTGYHPIGRFTYSEVVVGDEHRSSRKTTRRLFPPLHYPYKTCISRRHQIAHSIEGRERR
ncbi:hypothetical protein ARMGADRAFT_58377 [Armillaria gallica]|uniref:Uncharacterized protein n=1 Tax=Armillaria gallica TaxID=47427 RepID=A0A2H3DT07_ARMGA|nr:hypothetical protein ARMGADRAFT_58377 [Armillaria gallica]